MKLSKKFDAAKLLPPEIHITTPTTHTSKISNSISIWAQNNPILHRSWRFCTVQPIQRYLSMYEWTHIFRSVRANGVTKNTIWSTDRFATAMKHLSGTWISTLKACSVRCESISPILCVFDTPASGGRIWHDAGRRYYPLGLVACSDSQSDCHSLDLFSFRVDDHDDNDDDDDAYHGR